MNRFLELVADIFEIDSKELTLDTVFRELDDFSSLVGYSLIIMMEEEYGVRVSVDEFIKCETLGDLYKKCKNSNN